MFRHAPQEIHRNLDSLPKVCNWTEILLLQTVKIWNALDPLLKLRTFSLIATAHPYCTRNFECYVMHRARVLSTKMNNDRAGGHCYGFPRILQSWRSGDPYFSFEKQILFTIISTLSKNKQKIIVGS